MRNKKLGRKFIILSGVLWVVLHAEALPRPKNTPPPRTPPANMEDPFEDGDFNLEEGPSSGEGPAEFPTEDESELPKKGKKGSQTRSLPKMPFPEEFSEDMSPLPPNDLPSLPQEKAPKEEVSGPVKEEAPAPFSWGSIDLHNLAKQAGRKADPYKA